MTFEERMRWLYVAARAWQARDAGRRLEDAVKMFRESAAQSVWANDLQALAEFIQEFAADAEQRGVYGVAASEVPTPEGWERYLYGVHSSVGGAGETYLTGHEEAPIDWDDDPEMVALDLPDAHPWCREAQRAYLATPWNGHPAGARVLLPNADGVGMPFFVEGERVTAWCKPSNKFDDVYKCYGVQNYPGNRITERDEFTSLVDACMKIRGIPGAYIERIKIYGDGRRSRDVVRHNPA